MTMMKCYGKRTGSFSITVLYFLEKLPDLVHFLGAGEGEHLKVLKVCVCFFVFSFYFNTVIVWMSYLTLMKLAQ